MTTYQGWDETSMMLVDIGEDPNAAVEQPEPHIAGRKRLADHVKKRRRALGLPGYRAATIAGISEGTWKWLEAGTHQTRSEAFPGIERALFWQPGTVEKILNAGPLREPEPERFLPPPVTPPSADQVLDSILAAPLSAEKKIIFVEAVLSQRGVDQRRLQLQTYEWIITAGPTPQTN